MISNNKAAFLRNYTLKIQPGVKQQFGLRGGVLRVISSLVPVYFESKENSSSFYLEAGEEVILNEGVFFNLDVFHLDAAEQTIVIAIGENAKIGSAKVSGVISGIVDLSAATLAALESVNVQNTVNIVNAGQAYGASYRSTVNLAANAAETIFTPASNLNGAIIHAASFIEYTGTSPYCNGAFLAKSSAPANSSDGDIILGADYLQNTVVTTPAANNAGSLKNPIKIAAGKGLYFITSVAHTQSSRSVLYTLL